MRLADSSVSKTRCRRKNVSRSAPHVPNMMSLVMHQVIPFFAISCVSNWKLQVTPLWNKQLQPLCSHPLPVSQGTYCPRSSTKTRWQDKGRLLLCTWWCINVLLNSANRNHWWWVFLPIILLKPPPGHFFTAENNAYCYRSGNAAFVHPPSFLSARPLCFVLLLSVAVSDDLISNTWSIRHINLVFYI